MELADKIVLVPIKKIKPYTRNPRKNEQTIKKLVDLIPKVGFNVPIVLDKNNTIVKGHSRWAAAIKLGMAEVPCIYTNADDEYVKLDRIADNRVIEFSGWIDDELLHELDMMMVDYSMLDFNIADHKEILGDDMITTESDLEKAKDKSVVAPSSQYYKMTCEECGHIQFIKADEKWNAE